MKRREFLLLTNLTAISLNALVRKGWVSQGGGRGLERRGWTDYTLMDAYRLDLTLAIDEVGMTQVEAAAFVRTEAAELFAGGLSFAQLARKETWFGFASIGSEDFDPESGRFVGATHVRPLVGTWSQVGRSLASARRDLKGQSLLSVALVNASERLRGLLRRAATFNLAAVVSEADAIPELKGAG
jgi:hypothetical protein